MTDIAAFEARITAALDRIRVGITDQNTDGVDADTLAALERERSVNADLAENLRSHKAQHEAELATLKQEIADFQGRMTQLDGELQSLRASNKQLREMNSAMREAVTEGLAPELLDQAAAAEVAALAAQRDADAAELDLVIDALKPLLKGTDHAAG